MDSPENRHPGCRRTKLSFENSILGDRSPVRVHRVRLAAGFDANPVRCRQANQVTSSVRRPNDTVSSRSARARPPGRSSIRSLRVPVVNRSERARWSGGCWRRLPSTSGSPGSVEYRVAPRVTAGESLTQSGPRYTRYPRRTVGGRPEASSWIDDISGRDGVGLAPCHRSDEVYRRRRRARAGRLSPSVDPCTESGPFATPCRRLYIARYDLHVVVRTSASLSVRRSRAV